jgi:ABC-type Mn2+/Zn2+ transport system ATPase subunit
MGENGLGKSTLLSRLRTALEGTVSIGWVPQAPFTSFYDRTLADFRRVLKASATDLDGSQFEELWRRFGLEDKKERLLSQLSGGELQALKLAVGLAKKAELLLLDEPGLSLDQQKLALLGEHLENLRAQGKTLLLVEHDLGWMPAGWDVIRLREFEGLLQRGESWTT